MFAIHCRDAGGPAPGGRGIAATVPERPGGSESRRVRRRPPPSSRAHSRSHSAAHPECLRRSREDTASSRRPLKSTPPCLSRQHRREVAAPCSFSRDIRNSGQPKCHGNFGYDGRWGQTKGCDDDTAYVFRGNCFRLLTNDGASLTGVCVGAGRAGDACVDSYEEIPLLDTLLQEIPL